MIVCFTQRSAVPCVFNTFDFYCRFVYHVLPVGHNLCNEDKCCVVTHCVADIVVASLGLFTWLVYYVHMYCVPRVL